MKIIRNILKNAFNNSLEDGKNNNITPSFLKPVKQLADRVYKNDKGFWEAELKNSITMIYIPKGEFTMGNNDLHKDYKNCPEHKIKLNSYWIGKYPVTFDQYDAYYTAKGFINDMGWGRGKLPVININWQKSVDYCNRLSEKFGLRFRLPTEAEWEKAAKGTGNNKYPWGNEDPDEELANYNNNAYKTTSAGQYPKGVSPYGCFDMAGNVIEWCNDWYNREYYKRSPSKNPKGPYNGIERVYRGGCWGEEIADYLQCSSRGKTYPSFCLEANGFRLMIEL